MALGVDIDGTVCDFVTAAVMAFNRTLDQHISVAAAYSRYAIQDVYGLDSLEFNGLFQALEADIYLTAPPFRRAQAILRAWATAGEQVTYITTRPWQYHAVTRAWLRRWGFPSGDIVHVRGTADKGPLARALGVSTLIDDHPDVFRTCSGTPGLDVVVASQPYNMALPATRRVFWADHLMKGDAIDDYTSIAI